MPCRTLHKSFAPTSDYQTYLTLLGQAEISFMPLRDTPFNRAKSDLKFIEAGAARVAALASPTVYEGSIRDGETGLLFRSPEELHERLTRLVMAPAYARGLAETAQSLGRRITHGCLSGARPRALVPQPARSAR